MRLKESLTTTKNNIGLIKITKNEHKDFNLGQIFSHKFEISVNIFFTLMT